MKMIALTPLSPHLQVINVEETSATQEIVRFISSPDENYQWTPNRLHGLKERFMSYALPRKSGRTPRKHAVEVYEPKVIQHRAAALYL